MYEISPYKVLAEKPKWKIPAAALLLSVVPAINGNVSLEERIAVQPIMAQQTTEKVPELYTSDDYETDVDPDYVLRQDPVKRNNLIIQALGDPIEVDGLGGGHGWIINGLFDPRTRRSYVLNSLDPSIKYTIKEHEKGFHAYADVWGLYQSEECADRTAAANTGMRDPNPGRNYIGYDGPSPPSYQPVIKITSNNTRYTV